MIGFGPEDDHFVLELTYNYGIKEYKLGNDFQVIYIMGLYCIIIFYMSYYTNEECFVHHTIFSSALTHTHTMNNSWDFLVWKLSD